MNRRSFLHRSTLGSLALGCQAPGAKAHATFALAGARDDEGLDLGSLAARILDADADEVLALGLGWLRAGRSPREVLGAAYLAGLREIDPSPIGGRVHALMMVSSAAETCASLAPERRALPVLFHLGSVQDSVRTDDQRRGWSLAAPPAFEDAPRDTHVADFHAAMRAWKEEDADRATTALFEHTGLRGYFEELWPYAARDFRIIGHKMIYAAQTFRALEDLGWRDGRSAVRSVVRGILDQNPFGRFDEAETKEILGVYEANRALAERFPKGWRNGTVAPQASLELLATLREVEARAAAGEVLALLDREVGEASIWDGLRLCAFELLQRHPNIAGVHPVTSLNAFAHAETLTAREDTRRLFLLQATSWLVFFREFLKGRSDPRELRVDARVEAPRAAAADPFGATSEDEARALAQAQVPKSLAGFRRRALDVLARKARHDHDYKFTVAALEEIGAAHPSLQGLLAGAAMSFLLREADADHPTVALLRR